MNSQENIKNLQKLWEEYQQAHPITDSKIEEIKIILNQWDIYKQKIVSGQLTLEEYTNRLTNQNSKETLPGGYLCNFLERSTSDIFGSSKPPTAYGFGVKLNENGSYYVHGVSQKSKESIGETKDIAETYFQNKIKPLFQKVVNASSVEELIAIVATSDYSAKQILMKLAVLAQPLQFIYLYADSSIDKLYQNYVIDNKDNKSVSYIKKNYEIFNNFISNFGVPLDKGVSTYQAIAKVEQLSDFLWQLVNPDYEILNDNSSPNIIFYGAPGTGKTYTVKSNINFLCKGDISHYEFVQFHPSFTYEDFIEGIKPKGVTQDGNIRFELVNGIFKNFCIKAKNDPDNNYYFIVDEINRANLSAVFGETLSLLESSYRHKVGTEENLISTQYSALIDELIKENEGKYKHLAYELIDIDGEQHSRFGIPANVYFIGMMNDIDKSIDTFDLALRRRFKWIRKDCDYEVIKNQIKFRNGDDFSNIEKFAECAEDLNKYIRIDLNLGSSYEFGHSFFMKISTIAKQREITSKNLDELFDLHLRPTLKEYLRAFYSESEIEAKLQEALNVFKGPITSTQKLDNQDKGTEQNEANSSN